MNSPKNPKKYNLANKILPNIAQIKESRYDWVLVVTLILLCMGGFAFLASSYAGRATSLLHPAFLQQLFFGIWLGGLGCFFLAKTDYHVWFKWSRLGLLATVLMVLFVAILPVYFVIADVGSDALGLQIRQQIIDAWPLPIKPYMANGAIRWIDLPFLPNFQPSELAKLTLLIYFACTLQKLGSSENINWYTLKRPIYSFVVITSLIIIQPDLGSVVLIALILLSAMWSAKVNWKILGPIGIAAGLVAVMAIALVSYRISRVQTFWAFATNPESICQGERGRGEYFHVCRSRQYIQAGGWWGKGYGNGQSKQVNPAANNTEATYVPEISTDAILVVIGEELGFVGTSAFLSLYLLLLWRGLQISKRAPDSGGKALATGISVWIVAQAFINLAGITGLIPLKGIPLPFVSGGGSALVLNLISMGILLNVSSQRLEVEAKGVKQTKTNTGALNNKNAVNLNGNLNNKPNNKNPASLGKKAVS